MIADYLNAMSLENASDFVFVAIVIVIAALLWHFAHMGWHVHRMHRARRLERRVIRGDRRRRTTRHWLLALIALNVADRIMDWRERYRNWRQGDQVVGDRLIGRIGKLR